MKYTTYGQDHPFAVIRGRVAGTAAVGTATLTTLQLVVITPSALAADTDDWNPTGLSTADIIRASTTATWNLTGIVAPGDDRIIILDNIGAFDLVLVHDATSTAANRFLCPGDVDLTLATDTNVWLQYDLASLRWRVVGGTGSGSIPAGTYELAVEGGQDVIQPHGSMGATETFDPTDGNVHTGTLNANCTFTVNAPTGTGAAGLVFVITGDGTSVITWPGSFTLIDGPFPVLGAGLTQEYIARTYDGGTSWVVSLAGGGSGSAIEILDEGVSLTASPTSIDFVGGGVTATAIGDAVTVTIPGGSGAHYLVIASTHSTPLVFADLIQNTAQDDLVYTT